MSRQLTPGRIIQTYLLGTVSTFLSCCILSWLLYFRVPAPAPDVLLPLLWGSLALVILIQPLFLVLFLFMKTHGEFKVTFAKVFFLGLTSLLIFYIYISRELILLFVAGGVSIH